MTTLKNARHARNYVHPHFCGFLSDEEERILMRMMHMRTNQSDEKKTRAKTKTVTLRRFSWED